MKILVFDKFLGYQVGGAQSSLHYLLKNLKGDFEFIGCEVKKAFSAEKYKIDANILIDTNDTNNINKIDANIRMNTNDTNIKRISIRECPRFPYFEYWLNRKKIENFITSQKADLLMAQGLWGAIAINAFSGKTIYFIRDEYHFNKIPIYQTGFKKFFKKIYLFSQWPFIRQVFQDNKKAIEKADLVMANSQFMANQIKKIFKKEAEYIYPLIDVLKLTETKTPSIDQREFITLIGSELIKGRPIVEKIAEIMPEHKFIIVGRNFSKPFWKNNVLYQPWTKNVSEIYQKTKIVLIPSIINEAFARVAVEAMALGIPALGSKRGGIPEVLDEEFLIEDMWNIQKWKEKILEIEKNYDKYPVNLKERALKFDAREQIEKFKEIIKDKFNISL